MATYLLTNKDGEIEIFEQEVNRSTSLVLAGKNVKDWGEHYAQNFVHLLSNFASDPVARPANPVSGQLWYNTADKSLYIFDKTTNLWVNTKQFATALNVRLTGAVTGEADFDGINDIEINTSMSVVNNAPGQYLSANIVVDEFGRVISASNGIQGDDGSTEVESFTVRSPTNTNRPTQIGAVVFTRDDVIHALGFTPYNATNPSNYAPAPNLTPYMMVDGSRAMSGNLNMNSNEIRNLAAPTTNNSAVRKVDLDNVANAKTRRVFQGQTSLSYNVTVSTSAPSGGSNGDVWYRY